MTLNRYHVFRQPTTRKHGRAPSALSMLALVLSMVVASCGFASDRPSASEDVAGAPQPAEGDDATGGSEDQQAGGDSGDPAGPDQVDDGSTDEDGAADIDSGGDSDDVGSADAADEGGGGDADGDGAAGSGGEGDGGGGDGGEGDGGEGDGGGGDGGEGDDGDGGGADDFLDAERFFDPTGSPGGDVPDGCGSGGVACMQALFNEGDYATVVRYADFLIGELETNPDIPDRDQIMADAATFAVAAKLRIGQIPAATARDELTRLHDAAVAPTSPELLEASLVEVNVILADEAQLATIFAEASDAALERFTELNRDLVPQLEELLAPDLLVNRLPQLFSGAQLTDELLQNPLLTDPLVPGDSEDGTLGP